MTARVRGHGSGLVTAVHLVYRHFFGSSHGWANSSGRSCETDSVFLEGLSAQCEWRLNMPWRRHTCSVFSCGFYSSYPSEKMELWVVITFSHSSFFFLAALLRCHSYTIQFTHLNCIILLFYCVQNCASAALLHFWIFSLAEAGNLPPLAVSLFTFKKKKGSCPESTQ